MVSPAPLSMNFDLSITPVQADGNTGDGKYHYAFSPSLIIAIESPLTVTIELTSDTPTYFIIEDLVTTDSKFQVGKHQVAAAGRNITFVNQNTQRCLIFMSVLVRDTKTGVLINCDPQMTNVPVGG
jgi:hypothetical protein